MRITYLLPDPGIPVGGSKGASVHVAEVTRAMASAGATVQLLAMRSARPAETVPETDSRSHGAAARSRAGRVDLRIFETGSFPRGPGGDPERRRAVEQFLDWSEDEARRFRPDLVYERLSLFAGGGTHLARRLGVPRIVEVNAPVASEREAHTGLALAADARQAERDALAGAHVVAVSAALEPWCRARGAASVQVIPNGVDTRRFDASQQARAAAALRQSLGLEGAQVVGFVGSMKPWHGVATLLEAVARLAPHRPALRVLLVGDGPAAAAARERAAEPDLAGRCRFTGAVAPDLIPAYLAALDVAVAPYDAPMADGAFYFSPLKVVEAMAAGRPVVASRFDPIEAMLAGTGLLVAAASAASLAGAIGELLDDPARAARLGAAARERAVSGFGWDAVVARILSAVPAPPARPVPDRAAEAV